MWLMSKRTMYEVEESRFIWRKEGKNHGSPGGDACELSSGVPKCASPQVPVRLRGTLPHSRLLLQPSPPTGTATCPITTSNWKRACGGWQKLVSWGVTGWRSGAHLACVFKDTILGYVDLNTCVWSAVQFFKGKCVVLLLGMLVYLMNVHKYNLTQTLLTNLCLKK